MPSLVSELIPFGAFAMFSWIIFTVVDGVRRWHQQKVVGQFQTKLLDKIGSVDELGAFMNSEGGTNFLKSIAVHSSPTGAPQLRILRAVQVGTVLVALGLGLFLYGAMNSSLPADARDAADLTATIFLTIGAGLLVSSWISYRLSRRMGLINGSGLATHDPQPTA